MRCWRERTGAATWPNLACFRSCQASSKATPSIALITSIRTGGTPIWKISPGTVRSATLRSCKGAPNATSACSTRLALSVLGRTSTSRSLVARISPCAASAWAPTTRYSTAWALNADNRSLKSECTGVFVVPGVAEPGQRPDGFDAFVDRHAAPIQVGRLGFARSDDPGGHAAVASLAFGHGRMLAQGTAGTATRSRRLTRRTPQRRG